MKNYFLEIFYITYWKFQKKWIFKPHFFIHIFNEKTDSAQFVLKHACKEDSIRIYVRVVSKQFRMLMIEAQFSITVISREKLAPGALNWHVCKSGRGGGYPKGGRLVPPGQAPPLSKNKLLLTQFTEVPTLPKQQVLT